MSLTLCVDLDGTIMNNPIGPYIFPTVYKHFLEQGCELDFESVARMIDQEWHAQEDGPDPSHIALDWQFAAERAARRLGVRYNLDWEQLTIEGCQSGFVSAIGAARKVLHTLKHRGVRLVVATQGLTKYQRPVLEAIDLWSVFDDALTLDTTGSYKNHPYFWRTVADCPKVAHCGDNFRQDVRGAQAVGIPVVWFNRKPTAAQQNEPDPIARARVEPPPDGNPTPAEAMVLDLTELPPTLEQLGLL